jgi:hypothetical protein
MLVDIDIGIRLSTVCSSMDNIPLPCAKALWEAATPALWETEYKNYLSARKCSRILTIGTLRESRPLNVESLDADVAVDLANWSKSTDGFGAMVLTGVLAM